MKGSSWAFVFRLSPPLVREFRQQMPEKSGFFLPTGSPDSLQRFEEGRGGNNEKVETSERGRAEIKWAGIHGELRPEREWVSQISFVSTFSLFKGLPFEAQ
jgi:hypothetical protein